MNSKLQYISQGATIEEHLHHIQNICEAGVDWVQLRIKKQPENVVLEAARQAKEICGKYDARLIINDFPAIAREVGADGVHVGKEDSSVEEARKIVGPEKIIGGTANTLEDILNHGRQGADYVGLGPFRFTPTKEKLSPVLGLAGYRQITEALRQQNISIPIIAIGGIGFADIPAIQEAGIYGIAVSGLLTHSSDPANLVNQIVEQFKAEYNVAHRR